MRLTRYLAALTCFGLMATGWSTNTRAQEPSVKVSVFAKDLLYPRGLKVGPDGNLYVAEAALQFGTFTASGRETDDIDILCGYGG